MREHILTKSYVLSDGKCSKTVICVITYDEIYSNMYLHVDNSLFSIYKVEPLFQGNLQVKGHELFSGVFENLKYCSLSNMVYESRGHCSSCDEKPEKYDNSKFMSNFNVLLSSLLNYKKYDPVCPFDTSNFDKKTKEEEKEKEKEEEKEKEKEKEEEKEEKEEEEKEEKAENDVFKFVNLLFGPKDTESIKKGVEMCTKFVDKMKKSDPNSDKVVNELVNIFDTYTKDCKSLKFENLGDMLGSPLKSEPKESKAEKEPKEEKEEKAEPKAEKAEKAETNDSFRVYYVRD